MTEIGIVIVTYNSARVIGACLDRCLAQDNVQVVVVDNASSDDTVAEVRKRPAVRLIANDTNLGFAAANNQGVASLSTPVVLLLNPDAWIEGGLAAMAAALDAPRVGAATGRLSGADGDFQQGFCVRRLPEPRVLVYELLGINRLFPNNRVNRRYRYLDFDPTLEQDVEQPAGAFLMVRRPVWEQLRGLDERFQPIWFEDVDFAARLKEAGFRIRYVPEGKATHEGGHSALALGWECRQVYWYANLLRYCSRWYSRLELVPVSGAVLVGSLVRTVAGICTLRNLKPVRVYVRVVGLVCRVLYRGRTGSLTVSPAKPTGLAAG